MHLSWELRSNKKFSFRVSAASTNIQVIPLSSMQALFIQHSKRMRRITSSSIACLTTIIFHVISKAVRFYKKKVIEHEMCFDFIYNFCLKYFSFQEEFSEILS